METKLVKIGGSFYVIVPSEFVKVYNLVTKESEDKYISNYIYYIEVSQDGKTITYKRMRKNEELEVSEKTNKKN